MAYTRHRIDNYRLYHSTFDYTTTHGTVCSIGCYTGNTYRGTMYFFKDDYPISGHSYTMDGKIGLFFRESQLARIITTLRYEKPLYIWHNDVDNRAGLDTSKEPIGEEET